MRTTRRAFLGSMLAGSVVRSIQPAGADGAEIDLGFPQPTRLMRGDSSVGAALRSGNRIDLGDRRPPRQSPNLAVRHTILRREFGDLRRHFIFEYYPWYSTNPYQHWDESHRIPPYDIASNYMPALGPYDSRSRRVVEQHARWIADSGVGAVNLSWWGQSSFPDRAVHGVMDVMRDHDIHVTFHLEPYSRNRSVRYVSDLLYLLTEYGERRRWDCFLLLENADGSSGPVFKSFGTILPKESQDCHGVTHQVGGFTPDDGWLRQTDRARETLRRDFDHVTLLADSLNFTRTRGCGFDGIALYDNFVRPDAWADIARRANDDDLLFSFNVNPGFDAIARRQVSPGSCYRPPRFEPGGAQPDWRLAAGREQARTLSLQRIDETLSETVALQGDTSLTNARRGFFLVYVNSFNEWHEGHQFEPMRNFDDLLASERPFGYHNAADGDYRIQHLRSRLGDVLSGP